MINLFFCLDFGCKKFNKIKKKLPIAFSNLFLIRKISFGFQNEAHQI